MACVGWRCAVCDSLAKTDVSAGLHLSAFQFIRKGSTAYNRVFGFSHYTRQKRSKSLAETIYDVAIIGGGPAGYTAAIRAGQLGLKAALIEKEAKLGGTCLHWGCIPTKSLLFNAEIYDYLKDAKEYGLEGLGEAKINWKTILDRKNQIIAKHAKGLDFLMRKNKVTVIPGYGKLTGAAKDGIHSVEVTGEGKGKAETVKAKNVIVATGSDAKLLPGLKTSDKILTNMEILTINGIPKSLVVIGAGAVGVEFGSIFRSFGSEITIVEYLPRLVPNEDEDVSKELARVFRKRGIESHVGAKVEKVEETKTGVKVTFTAADGKQVVKEGRQGSGSRGPCAAHREYWSGKDKDQARARLYQGQRVHADRGAWCLRDWRHRCGSAAVGARGRDGRCGGRCEDCGQVCASGQA